jgi:hypothetical protein
VEIEVEKDLVDLCLKNDIVVEVRPWSSSALDVRSKASAKAFHWERPVGPYRTIGNDAIGYVEQAMEGRWASWKAVSSELIVESDEPRQQHVNQ